MAKRELSNTLKSLKFMQRSAQKEEKPKKRDEEPVKPDGNFASPGPGLVRKCVVIMEGDPHPGAARGRMSFQNFNPSIDKLNQEADNHHQSEASTSSSGQQKGGTLGREKCSAQNGSYNTGVETGNIHDGGELKRKQSDVPAETHYPNKHQKKNSEDGNGTPNKYAKPDKLDWNVLRPSKDRSKKG